MGRWSIFSYFPFQLGYKGTRQSGSEPERFFVAVFFVWIFYALSKIIGKNRNLLFCQVKGNGHPAHIINQNHIKHFCQLRPCNEAFAGKLKI